MQKTNNLLKKKFGKLTLAGQLTLLYGIVFSLVFFTLSVFLMISAVTLYTRYSQDELTETALRVRDYIISGQRLTNENLAELYTGNNIGIRISDAYDSSVVLASNENFPAVQIHVPPPETDAFNFIPLRALDEQYMLSQNLVKYSGRAYLVEVSRNYDRELRTIILFTVAFLTANLLGILGMFSIGRHISRRLLAPIASVSHAAERISIEDLSQRISLTGPDDEIRKLSSTFNDMIARLEHSFEQQNRFVSDASHELRTPISVIQGYTNLLDRWGKTDPAVLQESIDSIKSETEHMSALVQKLLILAKADNGKRELQMSEVSLNKLANDVVKEAEVMSAPCELTLVENAQAEILGDYGLLKQMLWIFIDNSMKYCAEQPKIILRIFNDGSPCISVKDNGKGISQENLPHIFERFFRADKARSSKEASGTGLGLSIADRVVKQHKAKVEVQSELGKGTEIIVRFEL